MVVTKNEKTIKNIIAFYDVKGSKIKNTYKNNNNSIGIYYIYT